MLVGVVLRTDGGWGWERTVEESTAGEVHVDHAVLGAPGVFHVLAEAQVGNDTVHGAQFSVFDVFPDLFAKREVSSPYSLHQKQLLRFRRLNQFLRLRGIHGERFLAQDVLSGFQTEHGILVVVRVRCSHVDDVDVLVGHQLFVGAVGGGVGGTLAVLEEFPCSVGGGRRSGGYDGVLDIADFTG